ncbi:MAG: hypothetical protein QXJ93_00990 [Candidatus Rehaiarchaeum fermentans]|nr:hypothetical protein [Candidatus Rehaiarchaeum fermentans]
MAENFFLSGAAVISANTTTTLIKYTVNSQQRLLISSLSIDLNPVTYFSDVAFSLYINGQVVQFFNNINSQITQSYYPLPLVQNIIVEPGSTIEWQIIGLSSLGADTVTAFASLQGSLEAVG